MIYPIFLTLKSIFIITGMTDRKLHILIVSTLVATWLFSLPCTVRAGADKSGLSPNVLSLPSGPGSIEGLGESFEPQLNSGTSSYRVPLAVPPGRKGFAPNLSLVYNSGSGNGIFGMGWNAGFPYIQRQTDRGQPFYTDYPVKDNVDNDKDGTVDEYDEFDIFVFSDGEELVPTADGFWRCENESAFLRFKKESQGWTVQRKDGVRMIFGALPETRVQDAQNRVFHWHLQEMSDTNGNQIIFSYEKKDDTAQTYCTKIEYNISDTARMSVLFSYESRPDIITDYRPGFELKTAFRCIGVQMMENANPVRSFRFTYADTDDFQPLSLLTAIRRIGRDGVSELPPAEFSYTEFSVDTAKSRVMPDSPPTDLDDFNTDLIDLNGDALPDMLDTNSNPHRYYLNLGPDADGIIRWSDVRSMTNNLLLYLGTDNVQLADMDGDGKADLLDKYSQEIRYYKCNADMNWESGGTLENAGFFFSDPTVRLTDANNDKRIDVVQTAGSDQFVWINLKNGQWSSRHTATLPSAVLQFDRSTTRMADMNGDRIPDMIYLDSQVCYYYPGMGYGQYASRINMNNPPYPLLDLNRAFMADVNGDGLSDVVSADSSVRVWLNLGLESSDHSQGSFASSFSLSAPDLNAYNAFRLGDMNGSGSTDLVWNVSDGASLRMAFLDFAPQEQPYQLKSIRNGMGRTTTVSYRSSVWDMVRDRDAGSPWPETVPFPVSVVAETAVNDGIHTYAVSYAYHDGYYDAEKKEFRGFARADKEEIGDDSVPSLFSHFRYDTGISQEAFKGRPLSTEARNAADELFFREEYVWDSLIAASAVADEERSITFAFQSEKNRHIHEKSNSPVSLKWEYEFDTYGNMTRQTEHGRTDSGWNDERISIFTYSSTYPSGQSAWILDRPVEQEVTDENGNRAAHKRFYYDGFLTPGLLSRGNMTRAEDWISGEEYTVSLRNEYDAYGNIIAIYDPLYGTEPGHFREIVYDDVFHSFPVREIIHTGNTDLSMSADYDKGFGVMTSSTDFNGHTSSYAYDTFGRLTAVSKAPDSGHTAEYDYVLAHVLPNNTVINWVETRQRDGSADGFLRTRTFYDGLGRKIMTRSEGEESGQVVVTDTLQFNARSLPRKKYLPYFENGSLDFTDPTFNTGFTEHFYDALGREIRMNQPVDPQGRVYFSETEYSPFSRLVRDEEQTDPASPHFGCGMRYVEDGLLNKDGKGRLRQVFEIVKLSDTGEPLVSPTEWQTVYRYDLLDNLCGYTDSLGNQKIIEYDGLGRKTFMNDPDRGHMYYFYDAAGNLIRSRDAKNQVIRYAYDGANRLKAEYYGADTEVPDVEYHYDEAFGPVSQGNYWPSEAADAIAESLLSDSGFEAGSDLNADGLIDAADIVRAERTAGQQNTVTAENTKGFLSWVRDQSGEEHNSYDERGRVKWTVKRIMDAGPDDLQNFYTGMEYDSLDRLTKLTYPDATYVNYMYNSRGLLESVPNVVEKMDYNPAGQNQVQALACGTVTNYAYDHRLRLKRLHTVRTRDSLALQDLNYAYDGVSNITGITDSRGNAVLDAIGSELGILPDDARKFNATQSFAYDSLYRLTRAENPAVYVSIDYRYDPIGNMVLKNANLIEPDPMMDLGEMTSGGAGGSRGRIGREAGDPPGPHAVTGTEKGPDGGMSFGYDGNGNMVLDNGMTMAWNYQDRMINLQKGTKTVDYVYDYTNIRKRKKVTDPETGVTENAIYIDNLSETRNDNLVKYVYMGNNRIARADFYALSHNFEISNLYLHDHLGSTAFTLSSKAVIKELSLDYPYGTPRIERKSEGMANYKFTGKERDFESRLYYFETRYYSETKGKFNKVDILFSMVGEKELLIPNKLNLYNYCINNPIRFIDPLGTEDKPPEILINGNIYTNSSNTVYFSGIIMGNLDTEAVRSKNDYDYAVTSYREGDLLSIEWFSQAFTAFTINLFALAGIPVSPPDKGE
ncbi:MAG: toxin TcdB middle/N-terminal domain-containing protein, partial [Desulfococcaceae bacterium]|nr:toxin TcdB middle/N-terminal domain-containing protein [Desulfococcaceae bacterium]